MSRILRMLLLMLVVLGCTAPPPTHSHPEPKPFHGIQGVIEVTRPAANAVICADGAVTVEGKARGWFYFEATFPVTVVDVHGQPIGQFYATAQSVWMTEDFVAFRGVIPFREPQGLTGKIIFHRSNASGLPEHDLAYEMPVRFTHDCMK